MLMKRIFGLIDLLAFLHLKAWGVYRGPSKLHSWQGNNTGGGWAAQGLLWGPRALLRSQELGQALSTTARHGRFKAAHPPSQGAAGWRLYNMAWAAAGMAQGLLCGFGVARH